MPVYDYKCPDHGVFNDLATLEQHQEPMACPVCQTLSPRVFVVAPSVLAMAPDKRKAIETNERNQHEPAYSSKDRRQFDDQHRAGCGCDDRKLSPSKLMYTAQGDKMFPSMRPWMISH